MSASYFGWVGHYFGWVGVSRGVWGIILGGWENILVGWEWMGMSGGEWGQVHCLIMPISISLLLRKNKLFRLSVRHEIMNKIFFCYKETSL